MNLKNLIRIVATIALFPTLSFVIVACRKGVDLGSGSPAPATTTPSPQTGARITPPSNPAATPSKPGPVAPGEVPEMMKRAFTKEEMDKAIQQLPPEVRSRLQGMSYIPAEAKPVLPVKPSPTPTSRPK